MDSSAIREMLSGVFPPMVIPFHKDEILYEGLIGNVEKLNKTGLRGYFVCGTNGEFKSLAVEERLRVIEVVAKHASGDKVIMAGTAAESTKETIDLTLGAAERGAHLVSILLPSFFKKIIDDQVLEDYILAVADSSPIPVLIYNNPAVTGGVSLSIEILRRVSSHPNVAGMKDSSKGNYAGYIGAAKRDFCLLAGSAGFFLDLLKAGGVGGIMSLANVFPEKCVELYHLFISGNTEQADALNKRLVELNTQVSGLYSVAGVKAAMDIAGFTGGDPRRPLHAVSDQQRAGIAESLKRSGFLDEVEGNA